MLSALVARGVVVERSEIAQYHSGRLNYSWVGR